jgi:hypothetical protein
VGTGSLGLRTNTLFTLVLGEVRSYLSIYLSIWMSFVSFFMFSNFHWLGLHIKAWVAIANPRWIYAGFETLPPHILGIRIQIIGLHRGRAWHHLTLCTLVYVLLKAFVGFPITNLLIRTLYSLAPFMPKELATRRRKKGKQIQGIRVFTKSKVFSTGHVTQIQDVWMLSGSYTNQWPSVRWALGH